jgi:putative sterol carrier protein
MRDTKGAEKKREEKMFTRSTPLCYTIAVPAGAFPTFRKRKFEEKITMTVAESFEQMPNYLNSAAAAGMTKTLQWNITGDEAGMWALQIVDGEGKMIAGGVEKPDVTFTVSDKDWLAMAEGKLDAMNAFMTGKLKVAGDMMLAMKVQSLLKTPA